MNWYWNEPDKKWVNLAACFEIDVFHDGEGWAIIGSCPGPSSAIISRYETHEQAIKALEDLPLQRS